MIWCHVDFIRIPSYRLFHLPVRHFSSVVAVGPHKTECSVTVFGQKSLQLVFEYALYDSTLKAPVSLVMFDNNSALYACVLRCVRVCVCVCAVEETLKWFVPFGALRHLGEHSLNYARSSVIVPLSPLSLSPCPLCPLCVCPDRVLACPRSVRFATLRDFSFTHANLTANCQGTVGTTVEVILRLWLEKGLWSNVRWHFYVEWRDFSMN